MTTNPLHWRLSGPRCRATVLLLAGALAAACSSATAPVSTQWEGTLAPVLPATVGGRVGAVTQFGRTQVSIRIEEAEPGIAYGWRIDSGSCLANGVIQGGVASYPPMEPGAGGTATSGATLAKVFPASGEYAARVFLNETGTVVACGDLLLRD